MADAGAGDEAQAWQSARPSVKSSPGTMRQVSFCDFDHAGPTESLRSSVTHSGSLPSRLTHQNTVLSAFSQMTTDSSMKREKVSVAFSRTRADIVEESARYADFSQGSSPWKTSDGKVLWGQLRILLAKIIRTQQFEVFMGAIIISNLAIIVYEADLTGLCYPEYAEDLRKCPHEPSQLPWLTKLNMAYLLVYSLEVACHLYVSRSLFWWNRWNLLDLLVVMSGWLSFFMEGYHGFVNVNWLRIFRMVRLCRAFRIVLSIRELYFLLTGLVSSFKAIFFGTVLLGMMLVIWGIVLVEFVHPTNSTIEYVACERCSRGYRSVSASTLTLFQQIVTGDSWGRISIPVIEKEPALALLLIAIVISISSGVMNLILAVIVESAADARSKDLNERMKAQARAQQNTKMELLKICSEMDKDLSGTVSLQEMVDAWQENSSFRRLMTYLEVSQRELAAIFTVLDSRRCGEVDYTDFVNQLYELRTHDIRLMLAMTRLSVLDARNDVHVKIDSTQRRVDEQNSVIKQHQCLLEAMNSKLDLLLRRPGPQGGAPRGLAAAGADQAARRNPGPHFSGLQHAPPQAARHTEDAVAVAVPLTPPRSPGATARSSIGSDNSTLLFASDFRAENIPSLRGSLVSLQDQVDKYRYYGVRAPHDTHLDKKAPQKDSVSSRLVAQLQRKLAASVAELHADVEAHSRALARTLSEEVVHALGDGLFRDAPSEAPSTEPTVAPSPAPTPVPSRGASSAGLGSPPTLPVFSGDLADDPRFSGDMADDPRREEHVEECMAAKI